jgi:PII-like signaling protein
MLCVRFFVREGMRQEGKLAHEWLFDLAKSIGIEGGSVFRASAGYGRHGLHEDGFFELAGTLPETVEFFCEDDKIRRLIARVGEAGLKLVYVTHPIDVGTTG